MSITSMMNVVADMKRPIPDYDDMGGVTYSLTTFSASTPCRISQGVPVEISSGPTEYSEATAMIYALPVIEVLRDDEVHHGSDEYIVLGVQAPSVEHHVTLVCRLRTDGA